MSPEVSYPILANKEFVKPDDIERYIEFVFGGVDWQEHQWLGMRGIGEKNTPKDGKWQNDEFIQPYHGDPTERVIEVAKGWAGYHIATFVVPCVLKSRSGTADQVELFTVILADLDSGDTDAKLTHMAEHCGIPSMVVASGGTTETGHPKRHVYYRLSMPTRDIRRVVELRDQLWRKCGGDSTMGLGVQGNPYGRAHQPVRIAGTCHAKSGLARSCVIEAMPGGFYDLDELATAITAMPAGPWLPKEIAEKVVHEAPASAAGPMFTPSSGYVPVDLVTPVAPGGTDRTRWGEFSRNAGHYIHCVRMGQMDISMALENIKGWVATTMMEPWDEFKIEKEFRAILDKDIRAAGPLPAAEAPLAPPDAPDGILVWAAHRWVTDPKPEHEFLVDKLIIKGEPHLFAAEGGRARPAYSRTWP
jgi:putative DNA primase/helicase